MSLRLRIGLVTLLLLASGKAWSQPSLFPTRDSGPLLPDLAFTQPDKQKPPEKGKEKPPVVAQDMPAPESGLDLSDRRLPQAPEMLGDLPPPVFMAVPVVVQQFKQVTTKFVGQNGLLVTKTFLVPAGQVVVPGGAVPTSRGFKIADDGSPRPMDRVFLDFNFFNDILASTNVRLGGAIQNLNLYRESLGMEKTFLAGRASAGLSLPLNTVTMDSTFPNLNGTHTDVGDLTCYFRYALWRDQANDNWLTAGLAVTAPSGPSSIAGIDTPTILHSTLLQPYLGYLWNFGNFYLQGFLAVDTPTDTRDVTLLYNDVALGYFLYRTRDRSRFLTAVAPTLELHISDPVNHRGPLSIDNPLASFDIVDIGLGANIELFGRSRLALEVVSPLTGPRPFTIEALAQFRIRF
ncbi:MAG TPA: hypothetical protein VKE98_11560 [Gemmataceae bacterium]|nr:hypothetical protein [Gemmataceae bacterium]